MPLTASQVSAIKATRKRPRISCGNSLLLIVEAETRGGGKSFVGTTRFPPGRGGKQVDVRIGVYGKKVIATSKQQTTFGLRFASGTNNCDPRDLKKKQRKELVLKQSAPTLQRAVDDYLAASTLRASTLRLHQLPH